MTAAEALAYTDTRPEPWKDDAACTYTDPDSFFPEKGGTTRPAKRVCAGCPVKRDCLRTALSVGQRFGVWGGYSERERRQLMHSVTSQWARAAVSRRVNGHGVSCFCQDCKALHHAIVDMVVEKAIR